ncbi:MAG: hypothetical protein M3O61_03675 [Gemmatimonadota bacterium]|nr:hypothetical protein [Gemmatimonadota bacterium]
MQTVERTTERSRDLNLGREIDLAVTEWDPNEGSADADGNDLPPAKPLSRVVEAKRAGVTVRLGEIADHTGDMSELQVTLLVDGLHGPCFLEGFLRREQVDAMIELLQAARLKAEAVFVPRCS